MFTVSFCIFPCLISRCMELFVDLVLLIQAGLSISIRTHRLTLKEVRLFFFIFIAFLVSLLLEKGSWEQEGNLFLLT